MARSYTYDAANRMLSVGASNFTYDPAGNLHQAGNALLMSMVGGERLAIHRLDNGALNCRFVPGAGLDEYAGYYHGPRAAASTRRWPLADHLGSVVAYTDASAVTVVINTYDEYGRAGPTNAERLQYTGQFTLSPGLDLIHYRNRFYNPRLGRFMQTDPILYGDGLNLYGYVGNDPMNRVDPWGLATMVEGVVITAGTFDLLMFARMYWGEPGGWPEIMTGTVVFSGPVGSQSNIPMNAEQREIYCEGYDDAKLAVEILDAASNIADSVNAGLRAINAQNIPQVRGYMMASGLIGEGTGWGSAGVSLYLGVRYGDWASAVSGVTAQVADSAAADAYNRISRALGRPGRDLARIIVQNVAGESVDFGNSGPCAE